MRGILAVVTITIISIGFSSMAMVFGEESILWKSDYLVGILNYDIESVIPVKVTTFSKDSLKLEWEKPDIQTNEVIVGYHIQRKNIDSDFQTIEKNIDSKTLSYVDSYLSEGYYGYNVIPILEKQKADKISMHGIDRKNNLFSIYLKGQELIAKSILEQNCFKCLEPEFEEIDNVFSYEFSEHNKRQKSEFQEKITFEITKAKDFFDGLFEVKNNH